MTAMACGPLSWELSQGRGLAWLWHMVTLPSPTSPLCQGQQRQRTPGSFQTYVFLWDSPLSGAKISQRKQVPICYNLEISKIPLFMLCLFWKIEEMSTDKVSWRMFWKYCKTESQWKSNCKQAFIFRHHARPEQTKKAENKQEPQVKRSSQQPHSNAIYNIGVTSSNRSCKFNFKLLLGLKSWYCSLTRNWIKA